jgi:hypothetical protein
MEERKTYMEPKLYKSEESLEEMTLNAGVSPCDRPDWGNNWEWWKKHRGD